MSNNGIQIPRRLPLLLTHEGVLLPGSTVRISVNTPRNMHLVKSRLLKGTSLKSTIIGVIPNTRDPDHDTDDLSPLHRYGHPVITQRIPYTQCYLCEMVKIQIGFFFHSGTPVIDVS